jgi:ABC-type transporter Mla MlaB component
MHRWPVREATMSRYTLEREGTSVTITLAGDLFIDGVTELKELVGAAVEDGVKEVILDMVHTHDLDASALELLLAIQNSIWDGVNGLKLIHIPKGLFSFLSQLRVIERLNAQVG